MFHAKPYGQHQHFLKGGLRCGLQYCAMISVFSFAVYGHAQSDLEAPPFEYSKTTDSNRITELIRNVKDAEVQLVFEKKHGYLKSLLSELNILPSSQTLVFSKTSLQLNHISPQNPRAIYFNDDVYVAWINGSQIMEISTSDRKLGAAFYTLRMSPRRAHFSRQLYNCLACHTSTLTQGIPGHTIRSVLPNPDGTTDAGRESFITDHTSPISQRWGGWYVTGQHGDMQHMGNAIVRGDQLQTTDTGNWKDLGDRFYTPDWLTPHSDIVALMVLEHQTQMHNTFTYANFVVRKAKYDHQITYGIGADELAKAVPVTAQQELNYCIQNAAKRVVRYLLFIDEAQLDSEIRGSNAFAKEFAARGPTDRRGRSLRDFDLRNRLLRYPCSYMIYSSAFDDLEESLNAAVYKQLWNVLTNRDSSKDYRELKKADRKIVLTILRETKENLPEYWKAPP